MWRDLPTVKFLHLVGCTCWLLQATPATPVLDFSTYTDGDSLVQEDLVMWVTVGGYHIPLSEDAPNTPSTGAHAGFVLRWADVLCEGCLRCGAELRHCGAQTSTRAPCIALHGAVYWFAST